MTRAAVAGTSVRDLAARAAVRVSFLLGELAPDGDVDDLMTFLDASAERTRTPSGRSVWSLTDPERRRYLAELPIAELRAARAAGPAAEPSAVQDALDRSLDTGWTEEDLRRLSPAEARALCVVAGWWAGDREGVPDLVTVTVLVERLNLFADLEAMAVDHFVGRADALRQLRRHLSDDDPLPYAVFGLGGVGKSALIARHVVDAIGGAGGDGRAYAAVLDFDDPTLNPRYPLDIVQRLVRIVGLQADAEVRQRLDRLSTVALDAARTSVYRGQASSRSSSRPQGTQTDEVLGDLAAFSSRPILVVFDTVEQVQRRGASAVASFAGLVAQLGRFGSRIRVVISGRAPVPYLPATSHELSGLSRGEAVDLFTQLCTRAVEPALVESVVGALGTSPLTVRLAARLLSDIESAPGDLVALDLHAELIDGELYRRVLDHIRDPQVRKLAHPGLVLRRVTADIIAAVLSGPCDVPVPDLATAVELFDRLGQEAMLVDESPDGQTLVHRADIRRVMLPQLLADRPALADQIQEAAVEYYAGRRDTESKVEELYHRLMLQQDPATLTAHWDDRAAESLYAVADELPAASRIYLSRSLPETYLSDQDRRLVDDVGWLAEVEPQVTRLIGAGDSFQALARLRERRGPDGESLLPDLEIEALEALGSAGAAMDLARDRRRAAALANDHAGVTTYTLHLARLLERDNDPLAAGQVLEEALTAVKAPTVNRLRLLVAFLGLSRRQGDQPAARERCEAYAAEAAELHAQLDDTEEQRVPGLLRDLAAEVSANAAEILDEALFSIGVDASPRGLVAIALRDLDDSVAEQKGTRGLVAELAQIDLSSDEVPWTDISIKPRGETGRALLEVLSAFGSSADTLRSAVTADYQQEADAAYLGFDLHFGHKA